MKNSKISKLKFILFEEKEIKQLTIKYLVCFVCFISILSLLSCTSISEHEEINFHIPEDYLLEPDDIPIFWKNTLDEVHHILENHVQHGKVMKIGTSAGGRPVYGVFYGTQRHGQGTTTFSGSLGFFDVRAYRGTDHDKTVYLGMSAVHGFELEGIVGTLNLISILETGKDFRGKEWPEINAVAKKLDRLILIPVMNPDGRARVPIKMEILRGKLNYKANEFLNTGGYEDGSLIGWPEIKEFIPMDFKKFSFPGGYPNDAGVNIMHDDFFGNIQPETQALFDLCAAEKPDLILNMHTGAPWEDYFICMHKPFAEPALDETFEALYTWVHSQLALQGLKGTRDPEIEADISRVYKGAYNLDAALNLHCGALSVVVESPNHGFSGNNRSGETIVHTPEMILDAQLICHQESMKFLVNTGGRSKWTPGRKKR